VTQDRRIKRTQRLLAEALIALTLEKGYDSVTIREITERADVGYATFFRHYHDKDELLQEVLDVVLAGLLNLLTPAMTDADSQAVGVVLFRYVQEQSAVVRVLVGSGGVGQVASMRASSSAPASTGWTCRSSSSSRFPNGCTWSSEPSSST